MPGRPGGVADMPGKRSIRSGHPSLATLFAAEDLKGVQLSRPQQDFLQDIDSELFTRWELGRNLVLAYCQAGPVLELLIVPFAQPLHIMKTPGTLPVGEAVADGTRLRESREFQQFITQLLSGHRGLSPQAFEDAASLFTAVPLRLDIPSALQGDQFPTQAIEDLIRRYSFRYVENSAVILLDIVGFSLYEALEQATQLNSLIHSVNAAQSKLLTKDFEFNFARSTTGDGFYIWNRESSIESNINLYYLMQLILADNALAFAKSRTKETPRLKAAFHIGDHYEFYQAEALRPTMYNYIVGPVTIELARLIEGAQPGQIVVGDFETSLGVRGPAGDDLARLHTIDFIDRLQDGLSRLHGLTLAGESIEGIKCYLTGEAATDGSYRVTRYKVADKHGLSHPVYNAKINIYRTDGEPVFLGLQEEFAASKSVWRDSSLERRKIQ